MERLYLLLTIGSELQDGGGTHTVRVAIGSMIIDRTILSASSGETKLLTIDLGLSTCITRKDIDSIYFIANSSDSLFIEHVKIFDRQFFEIEINDWIDAQDLPQYEEQELYKYS